MTNQYALLPAERESEILLDYSIADPSTWRIERRESDGSVKEYVGVEEREFSAQQLEELFRVGAFVFFTKEHFDIWMNVWTAPENNQ